MSTLCSAVYLHLNVKFFQFQASIVSSPPRCSHSLCVNLQGKKKKSSRERSFWHFLFLSPALFSPCFDKQAWIESNSGPHTWPERSRGQMSDEGVGCSGDDLFFIFLFLQIMQISQHSQIWCHSLLLLLCHNLTVLHLFGKR